MKKRIIALALILVLMSSFISTVSVLASNEHTEQLYINLGILPPKRTSGLIKPVLNREQVADILLKIQGITYAPEVVDLANDISKSQYKNEINYCLSYGYLTMDESGSFNPKEAISYADSIYALMKILGYEQIIKDRDDLTLYGMANKVGLLKGCSVLNREKLSYDEFYTLVCNAMQMRLAQPEFISEDYIETLHDRLGVIEKNGTVLANSHYAAGVELTSANHVNIGGEVYRSNIEIGNDLIGISVTYYIKDDIVVSVSPNHKVKSLTLSASEIDSVTDNGSTLVLKYDDNEKATINKSALAIVNNKASSPSKALFDKLKNGSVTLVDSKNSGTYDVVHMDIVKTLKVSGISSLNYTIRPEIGNDAVKLEKVKKNLEIYINGKTGSFEDIKPGNIISVVCDAYSFTNGEIVFDYDNAKHVKILVSNSKMNGMIEACEGSDTVYIDDIEYKLSQSLTKLISGGSRDRINPGDYIIAYMDAYGNIADFEIDKTKNSYEYGYLIRAALDGTALKKTLYMKIMDSSGKIDVYTVDKKFFVDGKGFEDKALTYNVGTGENVDFSKRQVIKFKLNDEGVIKKIDTLQKSSAEYDSSLRESLEFDPYSQGLSKYVLRSNVVNKKIGISNDCVIFVDSAGLGMSNPDDYYFSILSPKDISGSAEYYMALYDADEIGVADCAAVWEGYDENEIVDTAVEKKKSLYYNKYSYMVEKVINTMDKDGNWGYEIVLADHKGKVSYKTVSTDILSFYSVKSVNESWVLTGDGGGRSDTECVDVYRQDADNMANILKGGDVVRFTLDANQNINYIERIFTFNDLKNSVQQITGTSGTHMLFAHLERANADLFRYSYDNTAVNPTAETFVFNPLTNEGVVVYDVKTKEVNVVDFYSVPSNYTGENAKVFLRDYHEGRTMEYFVYQY
ncbi:MAG: hypothetical protein E7392_00015 [Ruminococcaceae bacterium]|nr:hypothetical protein [Oscillospiraceae bacterium]